MVLLSKLWDNQFLPRGFCYRWEEDIMWLNGLGDALVSTGFFLLSFLIFYFLRRRPDIQYPALVTAVATFLLFCGFTRLLNVFLLWYPLYYVEALLKIGSGLVSLSAVGLLIFHFPQLLTVPSGKQMAEAYRRLQAEVHQHQLTEADLRQSEKRFRTVMENAPIGMGIMDLQGEWQEVNTALTGILGYSKKELLKMDLWTMTHVEDQHQDHLYMQQFLLGEITSIRQEKRFINKSGKVVWCLVEKALVTNIDGAPDYIIAQIVNISEQKQSEQQLRELNASLEQKVDERTEALRESNQDMENFIFAVTHDLRLPLTNLSGLIEVVEEELGAAAEGNPDASFALKMINRNSQRMDQLLQDLLVFSRSGRLELKRNRLDMNELMQEVFSSVSLAYSRLPVTLDLDKLPPALGDEMAIKQVCQNLLDNAIKYASRRTAIRITVRGWTENGFAVYCVEDNGIGFDQAYSDQLFKLFQRLHSDEEFPGTGIGLATCHRLIAKHGGKMWGEGRPGIGASFYFSLPAIPVAEVAEV